MQPSSEQSSSGRLAVRRLVAWSVDCACVLGWAAIVAAVGIPLYLAGVVLFANDVTANVVSAVLLVAPVVLAAAWCESRQGAATPGKRLMRLTVRMGTRIPRFRTAVLRNSIKIGLPWLIGHAAVFALVDTGDGSVPVGVWFLVMGAYVLPVIWVVSILTRDGRSPYDRISRTEVSRAE